MKAQSPLSREEQFFYGDDPRAISVPDQTFFQQLFSFRSKGALSLEDELLSYADEVPKWLRPFWPHIVKLICYYLREWQIKNTMRSVDRQIEEFHAVQEQEEEKRETEMLELAVDIAKEQNPEATVKYVRVPTSGPRPLPAVVIESPNGELRISAPWNFSRDSSS